MIILIIMAVGIAVGALCFPKKWHGINEKIQLGSMLLLIFCMGISLGSKPNFFVELGTLGLKGVIFAIVPIIFSVALVYGLTSRLLKEKNEDD
ncbi:MAG: LysO family transporter [Cellulosilyticaceae bacterium]